MDYKYKTKGTCSREIYFSIEDGIITDIRFVGGCDGNLKAISKLAMGRSAVEIAEILRGNTCGFKPTSCADQLAQAIDKAIEADGE